MNDKRDRSGVKFLILMVAPVLLFGCLGAEAMQIALSGFAEEFIAELELDILEEEHSFEHQGTSNSIVSRYVTSEAPDEVRERLTAFHDGQEFWIMPIKEGWSKDGKVPMILEGTGKDIPPARVEEELERDLDTLDIEDKSRIDFFIICPWYRLGEETYATFNADSVVLTEDGTLIVRLHTRARRRCHDLIREE